MSANLDNDFTKTPTKGGKAFAPTFFSNDFGGKNNLFFSANLNI